MIIDCISDLHGTYPELEGGDLLIVAGDLTARDEPKQHREFTDWLFEQDYKRKMFIAGNHDGFLQRTPEYHLKREFNVEYLCDSGTEFEGLKIWGSPWTPEFCGWHFMLERGEQIKAKWDLIPDDTDILVTHGPAWGIRDSNEWDDRCGCEELLKALNRVKPGLHVFGHIHGAHGVSGVNFGTQRDTLCVNAAQMNENYYPENKPITIERKKEDGKNIYIHKRRAA